MLNSFWYCGIFFNIWERSLMLAWKAKHFSQNYSTTWTISILFHTKSSVNNNNTQWEINFITHIVSGHSLAFTKVLEKLCHLPTIMDIERQWRMDIYTCIQIVLTKIVSY